MKKATFFLLMTAFGLAAFSVSTVFADGEEEGTATPVPKTTGSAQVLKSVDVVTLEDGTEIRGRIIAAGPKAVVILVEKGDKVTQRTISRDKVAKVEKGKTVPERDEYETGVVDGHEKIISKKEGDENSSSETPDTPEKTSTRTPQKTKPAKTDKPAEIEKLTTSSKADKILEELSKHKSFKGLADILGRENALKMINNSRKQKHFQRILESHNAGDDIRARDMIDLFYRSRLKLEDETRKRAMRYLSDIAWQPKR
ncbi:MAG: hypothetical protein U5N86_12990 [Planctomycetota bacterium]|nr:hypothetical protein [Planctomycetota bacterium]